MQPANQLLNSLLHQLSALEGTTIPDNKLAEILGISPSALSRYRSGALPLDQIEMLMRILAQLPPERWNLELDYVLNKRVRTEPTGSLLGNLARGVLSKLGYSLGSVKNTLEYPVRLGSMRFTQAALFSNMLVTGTVGSGKTSSVLFPVLRQLSAMYNSNTLDANDHHQKWGGLVLDVKGEFYETLIYFLQASGRNALYDLQIVSPQVNYTLVKFIDPDTGRNWYVSADGGAEGCELDFIIRGYRINGEAIARTIFTNPDLLEWNEGALKELTFKLKHKPNFIGWRYEGEELVAVDYTDEPGEIHKRRTTTGALITADIPEKLKYVGMEYVDRGIRYNICSPHLPAAEVASRLISIAETMGGSGSDNQYWTDSAKKHMGFVIYLWRAIHKDAPCSAVEILRLTSQKSALDEQLALLTSKLQLLGEEIIDAAPEKRKDMDAKRRLLVDVERYFVEEWYKLDPKTKGIIISVISNLFGPFLTDSSLQDVFCSRTTINFEDAIQKGRIVALLTPGHYETLARQLGMSLKYDFQSMAKQRTTQPHLNKTRVLLFFTDEGQVFVSSGGGNNTGDENFMALSRQSRVINVIAAQSDSSIISVIGDKKAPVYFQSFGSRVWLQNVDYETNMNAARMLGKIKKDKVATSGKEVDVESFFGKDGGPDGNTEYEEDERFSLEAFANLNTFDGVIYNKDVAGAKGKSCKFKGSPDPVGMEEKEARLTTLLWYYQAIVENRLHELERVLPE